MTTTDDMVLPDRMGLEDTLSPVDLPPPAEPLPDSLLWATIVIAIATLVLLALSATALRGWAYELEPGRYTSPVIAAAEDWHDAAERLGLTAPTDAMRGWWERARAWEFSGETEMPMPTPESAPSDRRRDRPAG